MAQASKAEQQEVFVRLGDAFLAASAARVAELERELDARVGKLYAIESNGQ